MYIHRFLKKEKGPIQVAPERSESDRKEIEDHSTAEQINVLIFLC